MVWFPSQLIVRQIIALQVGEHKQTTQLIVAEAFEMIQM